MVFESSWFNFNKMGNSKIRLFCLPYAGGSASSYYSWRKLLDEQIELVPIELSGHGRRNKEPFISGMKEVVDDVYLQIKDLLDEVPYAIFGHSMGSILAYELGRTIAIHNRKLPIHMFFSGRFPPYLETVRTNYHSLPDDVFLENFAKLGGISSELLEHKEVMDYLTPIFKADCKLVETYTHEGRVLQFPCKISVLYGAEDSMCNHSELQEWQDCSVSPISLLSYPSGHFFIQDTKEQVVKDIVKILIEKL